MDGETVLVCLAQEMAILLHKLYIGNLSKLNEEQRNGCLIKTEGCIVIFVCCILKPQDQKKINVRKFFQGDLKSPIGSI